MNGSKVGFLFIDFFQLSVFGLVQTTDYLVINNNSLETFQAAVTLCSSAALRMCLQGETILVQQWPLPGLIHAVSTGLRPACRGKGLIVMLGADLWLTGLSGAQSVGHSTNLRYPCPWWLLRKDRLTGWFILWLTDLFPDWPNGRLTDPVMTERWVWPTRCRMGNVERTESNPTYLFV